MDVNFDVRQLRMFIEVAETGVISKAADRLARTQAAISMQLQRIENDLDMHLLERTSRGVSLTEAGRAFLVYARKTVALTEDMQRGLVDRRLEGKIRIGMFEDLAVTNLPLAIAQFRQAHPYVQIELTSSYSAELAQLLQEGFIDLAIADPARFTTPSKMHISRQLVWAASRMITIEEKHSLPIIMFQTPCPWQDRMLSSLAEKGIHWHVGCRVRSLPAMLSAMRAGLGLGLLFPQALPDDCEIVDGQYDLPAAPLAILGLFIADGATSLAQDFAALLQRDF